MISQYFQFFVIYSIFICLISCYDDWVYKTVRDAEEKDENINPCGICKLLTDSFSKALDSTQNNFDDKNYENSEVRLTEIQEKLCLELQHGKNKCLKLAQESEDHIENWWFNYKKKEDLFQYLCILKSKSCCLPGHYGEKCSKCPGYPLNICNKNGICDGDGTRLGDGKCICNEGSKGIECEDCDLNYTKIDGICQKCDSACKNGCTKLGKEGCNTGGCADGFKLNDKGVCEDIDECKDNSKICSDGKVCQNTYGSYLCIDCHKVCKTCFGFASDQCFECADNYVKEGKKCIPYEESIKSNRMEILKYLFYVTLTIISCILMAKKPLVALIITVFLSAIIGLSEYANLNNLNGILEAFEELFL